MTVAVDGQSHLMELARVAMRAPNEERVESCCLGLDRGEVAHAPLVESTLVVDDEDVPRARVFDRVEEHVHAAGMLDGPRGPVNKRGEDGTKPRGSGAASQLQAHACVSDGGCWERHDEAARLERMSTTLLHPEVCGCSQKVLRITSLPRSRSTMRSKPADSNRLGTPVKAKAPGTRLPCGWMG